MTFYNHKTCCFTTVVYGWYQDFIPIYIYSILESFPQHYVKIFVLEELKQNNKESLEFIKQNLSDRFEVVDNFTDLDWCELPHKASMRFLLTREYFEEFDYVYFGDVDMLIYNVFNDNFVEYYLKHCEKTGLPFSNEYNYYENKYRATGLHFIIKEPYFDAMDKIIEKMKQPKPMGGWWNNSFRSQCFHNPQDPSYDEELLYHMISKTFDLRLLTNYGRPNHGWHLGEYRYYYLNNYKSEYYFRLRAMLLAEKSFQKMSEINDYQKIKNMTNTSIFKFLHSKMEGKAKDVVDLSIKIFDRKPFV